MKRRTLVFAAAALLALLLPTVAVGAYGGGSSGNGIRGTITDALGNPIEYIGVRGFKQVGDTWQETYFSWTGANGVYEMPFWGQGVTVKLYFFQKHVAPEDAIWRPEWYDDAETIETATPLVVASTAWVTADVVMAGAGSISGRVTATGTGDPVAGVKVIAHPAGVVPDGGGDARYEPPGVVTDAAGYYQVGPLHAGDWILEFRDPGKLWSDQWSGGGMVEDLATPVAVAADSTTTADAQLSPGGGVAVYPVSVEAGRSADGRGGDPGMGEVCLDAFDPEGNLVAGRRDTWDWVFVLPTGTYFFRFSDCTDPVDYVTTWYPAATEREDAEPIAVTAGKWNGTYYIFTAGKCGGLMPTIVGTDKDDLLVGTTGKDVISSGMGSDTVWALGGNDVVCLGDGADFVMCGSGRDRLYGQRGNDDMGGGYHDDRVDGGGGDDRVRGGEGSDTLIGGRGRDRIDGGPGTNSCLLGERLTDC